MIVTAEQLRAFERDEAVAERGPLGAASDHANVESHAEPVLSSQNQRAFAADASPRGSGVEQIQKLQLLFRGQERRFKRIARQLAQVLVGESEGLLRELIFTR